MATVNVLSHTVVPGTATALCMINNTQVFADGVEVYSSNTASHLRSVVVSHAESLTWEAIECICVRAKSCLGLIGADRFVVVLSVRSVL